MTNFNFLTDIKLSEVVVPRAIQPKSKVSKNPVGLSLRVYKNGSVYPSQELSDRFHLEYGMKDSELEHNGLDIVNSNQWAQFPKDVQPVLFLAPVNKNSAKVDLFGSVRYNEDNTPKSSVMNQGIKNEDLVNHLRDVFNLHIATLNANEGIAGTVVDNLFGSNNFVDLDVITDNTLSVEIAYLPKTVSRGPEKGSIKTERRDNIVMYPVIIRTNNVEQVLVETNETEEINS